MKRKLSSPEPAMLVYYFAKLTGLAQFTVKNNRFHPQTFLGKLYSVFLAITCFLIFPMAVLSRIENSDESDYLQMKVITSKFHRLFITVSVILPLMIFLFMDKKILYILEKLRSMNDSLKDLGIEEDRKCFFENLFVTAVIANFVVLAVAVLSVFTLPAWTLLDAIKYGLDVWFKSNMLMIFAQTVLFIKKRFILLNNELYDLVRRDDFRLSAEEGRGLVDFHRLRRIEILHMELCDLVYRTTHIFAASIFFNILQYGAELMLLTFEMYSIYQNSSTIFTLEEIVSYITNVSSYLLKSIVIVVHLTVIARASASVCRKGNAAKESVSKVCVGTKSPELEEEFFMFSLQLKQRPVKVFAFGFFDLGYSLLSQVFSAVVAYTIVMIQLDMAQPRSG